MYSRWFGGVFWLTGQYTVNKVEAILSILFPSRFLIFSGSFIILEADITKYCVSTMLYMIIHQHKC